MNLLKFAINLAQKAGKIALKISQKNFKITEKSKNNLITKADKTCEKIIIQKIKKYYPDDLILAEESSENFLEEFNSKYKIKGYTSSPKYIWLIDPIDGTTNYAHRLPLYSISIALFKMNSYDYSKNFEYLEGEIIMGVVHAPAMRETFWAAKDQGAFLNGKKIKISTTKKLVNSLMVTGFPYENKKINLPYFVKMLDHAQAVRRLGSAALDLSYIACGRFDGYWEFGLKPWDIAAGALIVKEAGGKVTDINGNLLDLFGNDILASNGKIHSQILKIFKDTARRPDCFAAENLQLQ